MTITIVQRAPVGSTANVQMTLPFDLRKKSRLRTQLDSGEEVALILERGMMLRGGDLLETQDGRIVAIVAADETVSTVTSDDPWQLSRAAYHLGNRHVSLQVGQGWLRYQHDHVLDEMVRGLGLKVETQTAPFEPEGGAYSHSHSQGLLSPRLHLHDH
jgi:urease accessory protein